MPVSPEELQAHIRTLGQPVKRLRLYRAMRDKGYSDAFAGIVALGTADADLDGQFELMELDPGPEPTQ